MAARGIIYGVDGNMVTSKHVDFINPQESPCGCGTTREEAVAALAEDAKKWEGSTVEEIEVDGLKLKRLRLGKAS